MFSCGQKRRLSILRISSFNTATGQFLLRHIQLLYTKKLNVSLPKKYAFQISKNIDLT